MRQGLVILLLFLVLLIAHTIQTTIHVTQAIQVATITVKKFEDRAEIVVTNVTDLMAFQFDVYPVANITKGEAVESWGFFNVSNGRVVALSYPSEPIDGGVVAVVDNPNIILKNVVLSNSEGEEIPFTIEYVEAYAEQTKEQIKQQIISLIFQYLNAGGEEKQAIKQQIIQLIFEYMNAS
jgi:hypothetical protein